MSERVVNIKLQADASGVVSGFASARDAANQFKDRAVEGGRKLTDLAMSNRQEWTTVGRTLTAVGVAVTGLGVAALRTGIQYNTLQQTSRAALTSILGSAAAANAQMDKLDEFARTSPFAKQTFIQAQQQMLAFGIEAKNVIPYLDSIQNAVAAAGGSNEDIAGLAEIFGKISSTSKITAVDLMQFGRRGIDAAQLIGDAMGKTAGEIRSEITAGTLDADKALDALSQGMSTKFEGAADNVKDTFAGAMDRVKAAWRDFAAELATPLVDPNGGGALVDLLNWTADALRNFEQLPEPVKLTVTALTGLVGVGALAGGTFMLALPRIVEFNAALATLGLTSGVAKAGLMSTLRFLTGPWGMALIAGAATIAAFNAAMDASKTSADTFTDSLKQGKNALDVMQQTAADNEQGLTRVFANVSQHLENLPELMDKTAEKGRGFWSSMSFNENAALDTIEEFGAALANLAATDLPRAQAEFAKFATETGMSRDQMATALDTMGPLKSALLEAADAAGLATDDSTLLKIALGEIDPAAESSAQSLESIQGAAEMTTEAVEELADSIANFGSVQMDADKAAIAFYESLDALEAQVAEGTNTLDLSTEAGRENQKSLLDIAKATNESAAATLNATGSQKQATSVLEQGRGALIRAAQQYGMTKAEAERYADQVLATPKTVSTYFDANIGDAQVKVQAIKDAIASIERSITVSLNVVGEAVGGKAYGGTVGYAYGGTVERAAFGKTISGVNGRVHDGTVYGAGTSKSDSVLTLLSRGEEVIQEPFASMYRPELKAMNRGEFQASTPQPQIVVVNENAGGKQIQFGDVSFGATDQRNEFREFDRTVTRMMRSV